AFVILFLMIDFNEFLMHPNVIFLRVLFAKWNIDWKDIFYGILALAITFGAFWLVLKEPENKK
ncbi:MAG: hypothetical protein QW210_02610, partial [Candidatus Woesearchaeota archaeon]